MYSWKISKWKKKGVEQHSSFVKRKSVCVGIRIYKSWKETEGTGSGYLFLVVGAEKGRWEIRRGCFLVLSDQNVFLIQTIIFKKIG